MTTLHNQTIDGAGNIINDEYVEIPQQSLDSTAAFATLLVVKGVVDITDAANAVHLQPADLTAEAEAWAVAAAVEG